MVKLRCPITQGLKGCRMAGIVLPEDPKEKIIRLDKGDTIQVPLGVVSWWLNDGESDLVIYFLGDTSEALTPGEITYFYLAGNNGILNGFSIEFITKTFQVDEAQASKLIGSQPRV